MIEMETTWVRVGPTPHYKHEHIHQAISDPENQPPGGGWTVAWCSSKHIPFRDGYAVAIHWQRGMTE